MSELEQLDTWLTIRIREYEAKADEFRRENLMHMLTVYNAKANEAMSIRLQLREWKRGAE